MPLRIVNDLNLKNSDGKLMEYYFNIAYLDNRNESYPSGAPMSHMFKTAVQAARNYGDEISIISPEPDEYLYTSDVVITASFSRFAEMVNVEETKLYIGDWDVSRFLLKYNDFISFAPRTVPSGRNRIRIEFFDNNANLVASREWFFNGIGTRAVQTGTEELKMTGRVFAEARQEELVDGEYKNPYNQAGFQIAGTYNNFNFGGRVYVSNQEKSDRQPVNRFSGFGKYDFWDNRYIRVDVGDSYPKLNSMIMQNILIRGVYSRLYLKAINVDFAYGTHLRGIEGAAGVDTTTGNILNPGTFKRKILAVRPSFGSGENFQLGFTFLKGNDDTSSISYGVNPEENVAGGMDLFFSLDKDRIIFEGNINPGHGTDLAESPLRGYPAP